MPTGKSLGKTQYSDSEDSHGQESTQRVWDAVRVILFACVGVCLATVHAALNRHAEMPVPVPGDAHRASEGPA